MENNCCIVVANTHGGMVATKNYFMRTRNLTQIWAVTLRY